MGNAEFREMNRRQYLLWGFEIAAPIAALIWWQWMTLAIWWTAQQSIEARAVALARLTKLIFPAPMFDRVTLIVDVQGHINTSPAIIAAVQSPLFASLRFDAWLYLLLPPAIGILAAMAILYTAHRLRTRKGKTEHIRGAEIDDRT
jgi:hypothetical protein